MRNKKVKKLTIQLIENFTYFLVLIALTIALFFLYLFVLGLLITISASGKIFWFFILLIFFLVLRECFK